ncbi:MAG: hypothetical protein WC511_03040 [Candidatus Pacearchaeota archaeon]
MSIKYSLLISTTPNNSINSDRLADEIRKSEISVALDYIETDATTVDIWMKASLSVEEEAILQNVVYTHSGLELVEQVYSTNDIYTTLAKVNAIRREINAPLYATAKVKFGLVTLMDVFCVTSEGIKFHVDGGMLDNSSEWIAVQSFVNLPIKLYDKRIVSHNLADSTAWTQTPGSSLFVITPDPGSKFILTHSIVRFPDNLKIVPTNKLYYQVFLSLDNVTPPTQPVISLVYEKVTDLFRKATAPFVVAPAIVPELGTNKVVEVLFQYADPHTLKGSPITLRASLGEKIQVYLEGNTPFLDIDDNPILQECTIAMNFRKTVEF